MNIDIAFFRDYVLLQGWLFVFLLFIGTCLYEYWNAYPVNCWFCNYNTVVPFLERNCFSCPKCDQYNGFKGDGDYNKEIPAQRDESLNKTLALASIPDDCNLDDYLPKIDCNGLCDKCNLIQRIRVKQLAEFEPMNMDNFDSEIEHYQRQLDKTYDLCADCKIVVTNSFRYGSSHSFARRIRAERMERTVQQHRSPRKTSKLLEYTNMRLSITRAILFILSIVNLSLFLNFDSFILQETSLPQSALLCNILSTCKYIGWEFIGKYLPKNYEFTISYLYILGLFVELLDTFIKHREQYLTNLSKAFAWIFLSLISLYVPKHSDIVLYWTELFCLSFLIYVYGLGKVSLKSSKKFKLKRIQSNKEKKSSSQGEKECLNLSGSSYKTGNSSYAAFNTRKLNQSMNSSCNETFNTSFNQDIDLSRHLNEVNISTFNTNSQRVSPNPFYNCNSRSQSPSNSFCLPSHNRSSGSTISETRNRNLPYRNSSPFQNELYRRDFGNAPISPPPCQFWNFPNQPYQSFNNGSRFISCNGIPSMSGGPTYVQPPPFNYNHIQNKINYNTGFLSVPHLWSSRPNTIGLNNSTFNTGCENFTPFGRSSLNPSFGNSHFSQGIYNRSPYIPNNFAPRNDLEQDDDDSSIGSSAESSGFISTDFVKCLSQSLPSSRESSPARQHIF